MLGGFVQVGGEMQAPGGDVAFDHLLQAGLINGYAAFIQDADFFSVQIQAQHVIANLGQAGAANQTDVTGADNRDFHVPP